jgi:hypothetical protein
VEQVILRGVSLRKGPHSRRWVLKKIFERRRDELSEIRSRPWPPSVQDTHDYGRAVTLYIEARDAWRRIRGWQ